MLPMLALLSGPAGAATQMECQALIARVPVTVDTVDSIAGVCLFSDVRFGAAPTAWRADRISLGGDIDALPDALPVRLSGGVTGLAIDPIIEGYPGMAWLIRQQAEPGISISFDTTSEAGVLRINSLLFRMDETNEISVTARLAGVPEVWPVNPVSVAALTVQALDVEVSFDGMFETLFLMPLGSAVLDTTMDAEPQVQALRDTAGTFLAQFADTAQAENTQRAQAFLDALPHPRGVLEIGIGGEGLSALHLMPLVTGSISPDFVTRVADAAELDIYWAPTAP